MAKTSVHKDNNCKICKKTLLGACYGHLPPRHVNSVPWCEVIVDLIGPWKVEIQGQEIFFKYTDIYKSSHQLS